MRSLSWLLLLAALFAGACTPRVSKQELARWRAHEANVTITRDDWGIAHVHGTTDADAVFGMIWAQAEDDFHRIEMNYLDSQGRRAEAEGEGAIWRDLRMKLFVDPDTMQARYAASPAWLRELMQAWADGLNDWLYRHPNVKPLVLTRFEPWMALTFSEGSIGGDIETVSLSGLEAFYGDTAAATLAAAGERLPREPSGSNGIAIAPANTVDGRTLLLINPHTSFFFRSELQMTSDQGLDAYGAVTWGQFFVYQGFSEHLGWMHTSSGVDAIDEYAETIVRRGDSLFYRYGDGERPVAVRTIEVPYRAGSKLATRTFTVYRTQHGPIVRSEGGRWIAVRLMDEPVKALAQSYARTKAHTLDEYRTLMALHANSSNNTVFASADGDIGYFHANFIPRRDPRFDWRRPVDGSNPATEWQGLLSNDESPHVVNPPNGWVYNSNNWPWSAAGPYSPKRADYPAYVEKGGENPRGVHALKLLAGRHDFSLEALRALAFDPWLPEFTLLRPPLLESYDALAPDDWLRAKLAEPIDSLRGWDDRWDVRSVPTTLAVFWGEELWRRSLPKAREADVPIYDWLADRLTPTDRIEAFSAAIDTLRARFGTWKIAWGEVNRFQRLTDDLVHPFDDDAPSIPVGFTSSRWGALASFVARPDEGTKKLYGTSGNSFVAVVSFGDSVRAIAVTAGGESGDPKSPHFDDQAERYATGNLRPVYFYPGQLVGHTGRTYHPGR